MDVQEPRQTVLRRAKASPENTVAKQMLESPGIGDFITRAAFARWVDEVYWIRSDFAQGGYNGPAPG
eukprot:CAMPEP_0202086246 /NCGR_PEP_ID=MMETSP0964-20121228/32971_1 /ASSEMBLY_ACC=CAM_ASM_000500 /TAXON_ID=4773 /ORGANISM="Schizochytrium aggregatum, Strain ATCC28209" /LENGTH=66 /DNA_ID=CAMNT_0048654131 /DNA_START=1 /DNA_END=197 /DNA_ORIENTATION=+